LAASFDCRASHGTLVGLPPLRGDRPGAMPELHLLPPRCAAAASAPRVGPGRRLRRDRRDAGGSGLAGYTVWRGTAGASGSFTAIATSSGTSYSDTTVTSKVTYWYRSPPSRARVNQSQPSNVVTARPK
jgi:hypothetical protein